MQNSQNQNQNQNDAKSTIVTLSNGDKFIEPSIQDLCPELCALAGARDYLSRDYHIDKLYKILFRSANHTSKNIYFKKKDDMLFHKEPREDIYYHINELLNSSKQKRSTVIDQCNKFEALCKEFTDDKHPLSLQLIAETGHNHNNEDDNDVNNVLNKMIDQ